MRYFLPLLSLLSLLSCEQETPRPEKPLVLASVMPAPAIEPRAPTTPTAPEPAPATSDARAAPSGAPKTPKTAAAVERPSPKPAAPPAPTAEARKVTTAVGSGASGEGFRLSIQAPTPVKAGQSASAAVVLNAVEPYKCNEKYPYKLVLDPPAGGISFPAQTVRGMAIAEKRSSMSVPFAATQAGPATISGVLHFSICTADKCLIEKRKLSVTVQVD